MKIQTKDGREMVGFRIDRGQDVDSIIDGMFKMFDYIKKNPDKKHELIITDNPKRYAEE